MKRAYLREWFRRSCDRVASRRIVGFRRERAPEPHTYDGNDRAADTADPRVLKATPVAVLEIGFVQWSANFVWENELAPKPGPSTLR